MYIRFFRIFLILTSFFYAQAALAQINDVNTIRSLQLSMPRVSNAFAKYDNLLRQQFKNKGLKYPANNIYLRSFKAQNELEIWVRNEPTDTFTLFKKYKVCALSGVLGPKRTEGDRQVPEGLYFLSDFNPNSDFYLSMMVSYPNYSDMVLGNRDKPGGDIYVHGGCVTVGCLPMTDDGIQEIYTLCLNARLNGQTNIPIHIFPTRFDKTGLNFLGREYRNEPDKQRFWINIKSAYDYFERTHNLLPVMYNQEGRYIF